MPLHEYNTRTKKNEFQDALASLEVNLNNSIKSIKSDLKDEINNLKDVIIKRLQDENVILTSQYYQPIIVMVLLKYLIYFQKSVI